MPSLDKIYLFRMTHIDNVRHVQTHGITHFSSPNANIHYKPIGDGGLISRRNSFDLPNGKKLGSYIPFYFWGRMPMLYVIQKGFNGVAVTNPQDIVYCISTIALIEQLSLPYIFSDGHGTDGLTTFYEPSDIKDIETLLDFAAIKSKYWNDGKDLDLKRKKEAEFLVEKDIPFDAIGIFIVYNEDAKKNLIAKGIPEKMIKVNNSYYF